jgi:hypothetical protein
VVAEGIVVLIHPEVEVLAVPAVEAPEREAMVLVHLEQII